MTAANAATAGVAAGTVTVGSILLVAWLNGGRAPHSPPAEARRPTPPAPVVVAAPPPAPATELPALDAPVAPGPRAATAPPTAPPAPLPAVASSPLGPGTRSRLVPLGSSLGLPSIGTVPDSTPAAAASSRRVTTPARIRTRPAPRYPVLAQRRGIEGFVTLRLRVDAEGRVTNPVVLHSEPPGVFDDAAIRAVQQYRFEPARRGSRPAAATVQQTIRFELDR